MLASDASSTLPITLAKPSFPASRRAVLLAGAFIIFAALAAYHDSFAGPFIFDDTTAITENPTIRRLWPLWSAWFPPQGGLTVSGRPAVNFSLAVNYAFGGTAVPGYHALNLAIHILAGLTLFGVVRRTLLQPALQARFGAASCACGMVVALLWTLHPLQTESVTYIVQRTESLMGLFYLLTMYCFIRGTEARTPGLWHGLAVVVCLAGMASKEVMVSAPLMVLLYDRTFVAGTFREAWRRNRRLYLGLAGTWLLLGYLVAGTGSRGGTAGLDVGVGWWAYAATQFQAITHYFRLSVWPHPLAFEYGTYWVRRTLEIAPSALIVVPLVAGTLAGLWRGRAGGFIGFWFFAILAPTSLVPGTTQMIVEHRMYLPLAAVITPGVLGLHVWMGRRGLIACLALAVGLGWLTSRRNEDYRSTLSIWSDTAAKRPGNARAHNSLGDALFQLHRIAEAMERYEQALRINPDFVSAHMNRGSALFQMGRAPEAISEYKETLRIEPNNAAVHYNLGHALFQTGRLPEAIGHYEEALRINPDYAEAHMSLGSILSQTGRLPEAIAHYKEALRLKPDYADAHNNYGLALVQAGRLPEAIGHYEEALRLNPDYADAHYNLGNALIQAGRTSEAMEQYARTLLINPNFAEAHNNLGSALFQAGRLSEASQHYEQALRINPNDARARNNLARLKALQQTAGSDR